ncbi:MAG: protein-glutamate O-methyltransferase [Nitrospirae bacterium]|nr:protein-glutamate O-methyltransferase [Nitrospirota bacterium]
MESITDTATTEMSIKDFCRLSDFIHSQYGINLPNSKKVMLESRLKKRLRALNMRSYEEYSEYVFSKRGMENELVHMIDVVTTNKTDFYREPAHFDYLVQKALPDIADSRGAAAARPLKVWSAGCATGEEPYTLAMVISEFSNRCPELIHNHEILATDISTKALDLAKMAIYNEERTGPLPANLKKKYLMTSKDRTKRLVRITPELRSRVKFRRLNFMDSNFGISEPVDIIFCRNVLIYFTSKTQENLINRFCDHLIPGGYLFVGHSESLNGMNVPLISVAPTIYKKLQTESSGYNSGVNI